MRLIKKIKKTYFYSIFLRFIFIPFYSILWEFLLNFKNKIVSIIFKFKTINQEYIDLNKNSKKLVIENKTFQKFSEKINKDLSDQFLKKKIDELKSADYKKKFLANTKNEAIAKNPFLINVFSDLDLSTKKEIINFATSDFMLKTACNYLGVFPILARIYLNINIPVDNRQTSSQLWHRDDFGYKNLDFFLALNEINDKNGPLITLKKKDPYNIFYRIEKEIDSNLKGERGKILDKDFSLYRSDKEENLEILKGKSGSAMFIDSIRNYHKGGYCRSGTRIILRINYMTPDSTYPLEQLNEERSEWIKYINEKNFFNIYSLRKRNWIFKILKIPEVLFTLYHAVSIKVNE